jgi:hypothetical protein
MVVNAALGLLQTFELNGTVVKDTSTAAVIRYTLKSPYEQAEIDFQYKAYTLVWIMVQLQGVGDGNFPESLRLK